MTWRIWIDTGGTFTDAVALDPQDNLHTAKILSNSSLRGTIISQPQPQDIEIEAPWLNDQELNPLPTDFFTNARFRLHADPNSCKITKFAASSRQITLDRPISLKAQRTPFEIQFDEEAPVLAARLLTATSPNQILPSMQLRLATTRGTNALLEEQGAPTVLFVTAGFADLLEIGNQQRPNLFTLNIKRPNPLTSLIIEVPERITADGDIICPLEIGSLSHHLKARLSDANITPDYSQYSAAIALLNSHANPIHETILGTALQELGFTNIACSHQVAPFIRYLQRTQTTVVDAYLAPIIRTYLDRISKHLSTSSHIFVMTSAGGLQSAATYRAKDSLLSGPAGGVAGARVVAPLPAAAGGRAGPVQGGGAAAAGRTPPASRLAGVEGVAS